MYKLSHSDSIIRIEDNCFIPNDPNNRDYQKYLEWFDAGNSPEPADAIQSIPNWKALENSLRQSEVWAKAFGASTRTLKAQAAFSLLYGTLTVTHNLDDLRFSIMLLREAMSSIAGLGDFTSEEISFINAVLNNNNIALELN